MLPLSEGRATVLGRATGPVRPGDRLPAPTRSFDPNLRIRGIDVVRLGSDGDRWGLPVPGASSLFAGGRQRRRRVDEVIELVGATSYAHRPIGQMSGGEQQRLLIAQALVRRPSMLLLDEPLDSLDLPNQAAVAALISEISQRSGITVVIVAHDVNPIVPYLDGVVYVARGGAVCGSPDEVITSETLTTLYGTPIEVLRTSDGQMVVVGSPRRPPTTPTATPATRHTALMAPTHVRPAATVPTGPRPIHRRGPSWNLGRRPPPAARPSTSWSTPTGPGPSWPSSPGPSGGSWCSGARASPDTPWPWCRSPARPAPSGSASAPRPATSPGASWPRWPSPWCPAPPRVGPGARSPPSSAPCRPSPWPVGSCS